MPEKQMEKIINMKITLREKVELLHLASQLSRTSEGLTTIELIKSNYTELLKILEDETK